ncbi:hypothetical protein [Singulisphaera acidiphila]|uniref:Uncharacterized protein n=1 Tax=Singulisphaera acidiphila (strain ATCC BAA-1392 / DSM 18658 / VKM B-2454 / MOB10) TaxID=886293 RepID=L0D7P5_SINAD|nr:hypothetical protein [Singulisphaera acidiphila]AGA25409.1 hypothetical protein Sinac_1007 [Singulisphaera acidiphila DSM 18658]
MTRQAGLILRLIAYLVEMISMIGLVLASRQRVEPRLFAGLDPRQWSVGLAIGLFLWAISTAIIHWPRKKKRDRPQD